MRKTDLKIGASLVTLALATAGGALAKLAGLPLPWLLGAQMAVCAAALSRSNPFGFVPRWPEKSRLVFIPVMGVMIGGSFTADLIRQIPGWWPSILALFVFLTVAHWSVFLLYRRLGGYDVPTAYYASAPGGFVESVMFGSEAGGHAGIIATQHFTRILISVFLIPILFAAVLGHAVGSAAGASFATTAASGPAPADWLVLAAAAALGAWLGRLLCIPAGLLSGPILLGAAAHLSGLTAAQPPPVLLDITQIMIGTLLGVRFVGVARGDVVRAIALSGLGVVLMLALASPIAFFLAGHADGGFPVLILALAPGGVAEMSLVALSLGLSVPFVTIHHLLRISFALTFVPFQFRTVVRRLFPPGRA